MEESDQNLEWTHYTCTRTMFIGTVVWVLTSMHYTTAWVDASMLGHFISALTV